MCVKCNLCMLVNMLRTLFKGQYQNLYRLFHLTTFVLALNNFLKLIRLLNLVCMLENENVFEKCGHDKTVM